MTEETESISIFIASFSDKQVKEFMRRFLGLIAFIESDKDVITYQCGWNLDNLLKKGMKLFRKIVLGEKGVCELWDKD